MAKLAPIFNDAQLINGIPANGAKLFTYVAGSTTKLATYTGEDEGTSQSNPIVLNSRGEPAQPIWLSDGLTYKFVFAPADDTDPPTSPIRTIDNISGINDTSLVISQWVSSLVAPTYVSATQFTLAGDQTSEFQVNRRVKLTVTAGTLYGYISAAAYVSLTTVTVVLDSGVLDAGLTEVQLGLITPVNTSLFVIGNSNINNDSISLDKLERDGTLGQVLTSNGTGAAPTYEDLIVSEKIQPITASVGSNALTLTLNPTTLDFRSSTLTSGTVTTVSNASAISVVVSSGSTLGTVNAVQNRLAVIAINNAGTMELAVANLAGGVNLDETGIINTTAEGGAGGADSATVIYSTTARTGVAYRVVGFVESTQATAGTWANAPSLIQGYGGQALASMSSLGYGQKYQSVARVSGTTYYNTTGKPIHIMAGQAAAGAGSVVTVVVNAVSLPVFTAPAAGSSALMSFVVPPNQSYSITTTNTINIFELR